MTKEELGAYAVIDEGDSGPVAGQTQKSFERITQAGDVRVTQAGDVRVVEF